LLFYFDRILKRTIMKRIGLFTFIVLILYSTSISAEVYFQMDFEKMPLDEPAVRSYWSEQGFYPDTWDQGLKERTVVDNDYSSSGTNSMKVCYPKDEFGTDHTGCLLPLLFKEKKSKEMYASYMFRFSENFSYGTTSFGGKLPGLSGGDNCSGGSSCDGTNGFSARFMWRDGGKIVLYLYHMDKPSTYGEDVDLVEGNEGHYRVHDLLPPIGERQGPGGHAECIASRGRATGMVEKEDFEQRSSVGSRREVYDL
jgi:hypothetical protein